MCGNSPTPALTPPIIKGFEIVHFGDLVCICLLAKAKLLIKVV
jgi:hypothetical protein